MSRIYKLKSLEMQLESLPEFLSILEVAKVMRVSYMSIYRMIKMAEIDATLVGGSWRIPKLGLIDYLQQNNMFNID